MADGTPEASKTSSSRARADVGQKDGTLVLGAELTEPLALAIPGGHACVYSAPSPGAGRANEDSAGVIPLPDGGALLAVADGVGGHAQGASASQLALTQLARSLGTAVEETPSRALILDAIEETNRTLLDRGGGAATTLAVAEIADGAVRPYHIGDSEIWVVGGGGTMRWQTTSHSPTGYGVEAGLLDEEEAIHHDDRHLLSNALGAPDMTIEVGGFQSLRPRDTLLLGTDGLFDNLLSEEIVEIIRKGPLDRAASRLVGAAEKRMSGEHARRPSKPDDLTFILFRLER